MIDIYIVHNDPSIVDRVKKSNISTDAFFHFIDEGSLKERKKAFKLKSQWAAKMVPFIAIYEKDTMKKGFYSEADKDVLSSLISYLNTYNNGKID
jgi:hypothetical protein